MNERKRVGSVTELKIMTAFIELGYNCSQPYGDSEKYDFIVDIEGKLLRIQCKAAVPYNDGDAFTVDLRRKDYTHEGNIFTNYSHDEIDYFATYFDGKCYLIPLKENSTRRRFRIKPPKQNQTKYVSYARDYELEKVVKQWQKTL